MTSHGRRITCAAALLAATVGGAAHASVQIFFNNNSWVDAVGGQDAFATIGFNTGTPILLPPDYYAAEGVLFPEGDDFTGQFSSSPSGDGWALIFQTNTITIDLSTARTPLGVETLGSLYLMRLCSNGDLVEDVFVFGPFAGILSTTPFDRAVLTNFSTVGGVIIDDLHFGGIPSPGGLAVLVATTLLGGRGRRRRLP